MSFFLILFFVSLIAILFMIVRKLAYINHLEKHHEDMEENFLAEILDWNKLRHSTTKNLKRAGHISLWVILRTYILSLNFLNQKKKEISSKIKEKIEKHKRISPDGEATKEPSKYLHMISEYRKKIKHIKHKIKQEEGIE